MEAQGEPRSISVTISRADVSVPARVANSSSVPGGRLYVTASASMASPSQNQSLEYKTARIIEKSREQGWSELKDGCHDNAVGSSHDQDTQVIWSELKRWYPRTFQDMGERVELGQLIAEGGQAHIYEAKLQGVIHEWEKQYNYKKCVAKVYKMQGFSLADLQRQWPLRTKDIALGRGIASGEIIFNESLGNCNGVHFGTFLKDGRFAFLMVRRWGDLRTLIDLSLSHNNSQRPPFSHSQVVKIMRDIAWGMRELHSRGVLHRDLKSANILVRVSTNPQGDGLKCYVADFESSMLVQGTGFWRAPEVLAELQKHPSDRNVDIWTEKVDIYSYAMIFYEVLTGHVPFFGYGKHDWKRVIDGERPHLPQYVDLKFKDIVQRCWHKDPSHRPSFEDIESELGEIMRKQRL
ncbi:hypothetical protein KC19_11G136300 [Ceratodon purpureus]|uniref:Protein kinase domain-containing protein n=1 Tax=Ceratodon purpureus TaxID=3225 RepID=A0A8T0GH64_CERPU|nr:hypothetical protein KC19_11G136300 [Ceratodon purpureus]